MTKSKTTIRALLSSVMALLLCVSMMLGTTFAWFTDEVTSENNIIQSGTLDAVMLYGEKADAITNDASTGTIFKYEHWEPGYVDIKYVTIKNNGTLAFKYQLNIIPNVIVPEGEVDLADVIDVYLIPVDTANPTNVTRADIDDLEAAGASVGTLSSLMTDADGAAYGIMLPAEDKKAPDVTLNPEDEHLVAKDDADNYVNEITYCIVLKMQETAGNEYQNLSVGEGFKVQLLATQYTWEKDSIDHEYDKDAEYDKAPVAGVEKVEPKTETVTLPYNAVGEATVTLETAYVFTAPEEGETAAENPYAKWHADFVVTFDRNVTGADGIGLAGQYTYFSEDWFGALADEDVLSELAGEISWVNENGEIPAGAPIRLLGDIMGLTINYYELCDLVEVFKCGAWSSGDLTEDLTMTVQLRLYEAPSTGTSGTVESETGNYVVIGTYSHTFEAPETTNP